MITLNRIDDKTIRTSLETFLSQIGFSDERALNSPISCGILPIHCAILIGDAPSLSLLISLGADVHSRFDYQVSTLSSIQLALNQHPFNKSIIQILIENGASLNSRDDNVHPNHFYSLMYVGPMTSVFIKEGDEEQAKVEHDLYDSQCVDRITYLIEKGADIGLKGGRYGNETLLYWARVYSLKKTEDFLRMQGLIDENVKPRNLQELVKFDLGLFDLTIFERWGTSTYCIHLGVLCNRTSLDSLLLHRDECNKAISSAISTINQSEMMEAFFSRRIFRQIENHLNAFLQTVGANIYEVFSYSLGPKSIQR